MEKEREWKDYSDAEKYLAIKSYLEGMVKLDDNDASANRRRLEWIREHLPAYKTQKKNYIFISYAHRDYEKVYLDLAYFSYNSNTRVRFWYDEGLPVGEDWEEAAREFMRDPHCVGVVFYLSKNLLLSKSVLQEIDMVQEFGKPYFAVALNYDEYSAEKIFNNMQYGELLEVYGEIGDNKEQIEKIKNFFPPKNTAIIMGEDNAESRVAKISDKFDVTEEAFSDFVCEAVKNGLRLTEYRGNKTDVYIPTHIEDKPVVEISCGFKHAVTIHIPAKVESIDVAKLDEAYNLAAIKVDRKNKFYYDINGVLCSKKPFNAIVRVPVNWSWKNQFEDDGTMWKADFPKKKQGMRTIDANMLRHIMSSPVGKPIQDPFSTENVMSDAFHEEKYEIDSQDFKCLYLKLADKKELEDDCVNTSDGSEWGYFYSHFAKRTIEEDFVYTYDSPEKRYNVYSNLKKISAFKDIASISKNAFANCRQIDYLFLSDDIVNISKGAFKNSNVKLIYLPQKLLKIDDELFCDCKNLRSVLTQTDLFANKWNFGMINDVVLSGGIESIGVGAFQNTLINSLVIGDKIKVIDNSAFKNCEHLLKVALPQSVQSVGESAFENCFLLNQLAIDCSVVELGRLCFKNCVYLENIDINSTIRSLSYDAFVGCNSVKQITFNKTRKDWIELWGYSRLEFPMSSTRKWYYFRLSEEGKKIFEENGFDYEDEFEKKYFTLDSVPLNIQRAEVLCTDGFIGKE